jgi:hypothetical protein
MAAFAGSHPSQAKNEKIESTNNELLILNFLRGKNGPIILPLRTAK